MQLKFWHLGIEREQGVLPGRSRTARALVALLTFVALWPAAVAGAEPLRAVMLPLFRAHGIAQAQARRVQDALTVELVSHTDADLAPLSSLGNNARLHKIQVILGQQAPTGSFAQLLGTLAGGAGVERVLLARVDAVPGGGRVLLLTVVAGTSRALAVAEVRWLGTPQGPLPGLEAAVQKWVAPQPIGSVVTDLQWPAGAVAVDEAGTSDETPAPSPSEHAPPEQAAADPIEPTVAESAPRDTRPPSPVGVTAEARTNYYTDNDGNRIVTPAVTASGAVGEHFIVAGHATLDMMTCASVDVISAATPKGYFQEDRKEYGGAVTWQHEQRGVTLGATHSQENDYSSTTGSIALSSEFAKRNATVSFSYGFTGSDVGRAHDPTFARRLDSHAVTVGWTQVLGRQWIGQVSGFFGYLSGFQSSVYRFVHFTDGTSGPEVAPDERFRQAVVGELRGSLSPTWFTGASYRLYSDSWGVLSHTGEVTLSYAPTDWLTLRLRDRASLQRGASFYRSRYDQPMRYMTIDRELGAMHGNLAGVKLAIDLGSPARTSRWQLDLKYDWMWQHFDDFPWLTDRVMSMVEAGLQFDF